MRIRSENSNSYATFYALTHVVAALHLFFGGLLYFFTDWGIAPETAPLQCRIRQTSVSSNEVYSTFLDPVSIFFFRGEGSMKLACALTTLVLSKIRLLETKASAASTLRFNAGLYVAILLFSIPCWYLNTTSNNETYFKAELYFASMKSSSVLCALLLLGWILTCASSRAAPPSLLQTSVHHKIARSFMFLGGITGILLLLAPEACFGPSGWMPLVTSTTTPEGEPKFDPVMVYAARMFGMGHMPFFVAYWYASETTAALLFQMTCCALFLPLDVTGTLAFYTADVYNRPIFMAFTALHSVAFVVTGRAISIAVYKEQEKNKKDA